MRAILFRLMIDRVILIGMFFGVVAPFAVMLLLWHGSPVTATEALYSVTNQKEGRR